MKISNTGLDLIKSFEGFSAEPYKCPAGVPTIGYGSTYYEDGTRVRMGDDAISKLQAEHMLREQVDSIYGFAVNRYVKTDITQNQFDALTSFAYNLGAGNLKASTLLKKVNKSKHKAAAEQFLRWNRAGGKKLKGLTRRRETEMNLYLA